MYALLLAAVAVALLIVGVVTAKGVSAVVHAIVVGAPPSCSRAPCS
jgi:hypothetical protein